ncbi:MAG: choice-of-anchor J domain-containing protein [Bacteroidales bacterium]|nr:choice-of-anchor J domain-containing protein [Bacteroidales bacterium]
MKKFCSTLIVMLLCVAPWCGGKVAKCATADTVRLFPYTESFDSGLPDGWSCEDVDGDGASWQSLDSLLVDDGYAEPDFVAHSGSGAMVSLSSRPVRGVGYWRVESLALASVNRMASPWLVLPQEGLTLSFWLAAWRPDLRPDTLVVTLVDDEGTTLSTTNFVPSTMGYARCFIDLSTSSARPVRCVFEHRTVGAFALMVDDFEVSSPEKPRLAITAPRRVAVGEEVMFHHRVLNGVQASVGWHFGGARVEQVSGSPATAVWDSAGRFSVKLLAANNAGRDSAVTTIVVEDCSSATADGNYLETFDDTLGCWTVIDADGDGYGWKFERGDEALSGSGYAESESYLVYGPLAPDNWLVSPPIMVTEGADLAWNVASGSLLHPAEHYSVALISGSDTVEVWSETLDTTVGYVARRVQLGAFAGSEVRVAFRHHACSGEGSLRIDDVALGPNLAIRGTLASPQITFWPNPTTGRVQVGVKGLQRVEIYSIHGRLIRIFYNNVIELNDLPAGAYIAVAVSDGGIATAKLLKK